jgi:hypothetical protein
LSINPTLKLSGIVFPPLKFFVETFSLRLEVIVSLKDAENKFPCGPPDFNVRTTSPEFCVTANLGINTPPREVTPCPFDEVSAAKKFPACEEEPAPIVVPEPVKNNTDDESELNAPFITPLPVVLLNLMMLIE